MSQPFGDLLRPGEALIWQAPPMALGGATALRLGQVCFGLLALGWGGWRIVSVFALWQKTFGGLMILSPFMSAKTVLFPAVALVLGLVALWAAIAPWFRLRGTSYGLSARRAFVAEHGGAYVIDLAPQGLVALKRLGALSVMVIAVQPPGHDDESEQDVLRFENLLPQDYETALAFLKGRSDGGADGQ